MVYEHCNRKVEEMGSGIKNKAIQIRVTEFEDEKLLELCKKYDMNRSEMIRKMIREFE